MLFAGLAPLPAVEAVSFENFVGGKVAEFLDSLQELFSPLLPAHYPRLPVRHGGRNAVRATGWILRLACGFGIS